VAQDVGLVGILDQGVLQLGDGRVVLAGVLELDALVEQLLHLAGDLLDLLDLILVGLEFRPLLLDLGPLFGGQFRSQDALTRLQLEIFHPLVTDGGVGDIGKFLRDVPLHLDLHVVVPEGQAVQILAFLVGLHRVQPVHRLVAQGDLDALDGLLGGGVDDLPLDQPGRDGLEVDAPDGQTEDRNKRHGQQGFHRFH